jgi:hypothetical protein
MRSPVRTRSPILKGAACAIAVVAASAAGALPAQAAAASPAGGPGTTSLSLPASSGPGPAAVGSVLGPAVPALVPGAPTPPAVVTDPAAAPGSGQVSARAAGPTLTVTPDSGLTDGQKVTVTGSGYSSGSAGGMAECNNTPGQPTVAVYGNAVPVGCTNPLQSLQATDSSGGFSTSFTVRTGTIGPPAQGNDSAGRSASADAAAYPCPPTAAQAAAGNTCGISYGDAQGHQASANVTFASSGAASSSSATSSSAGSSPGSASAGSGSTVAGGSSVSGGTSKGAITAASGSGASGTVGTDPASGSSSGPLPFTGFGVGLWHLTLLGAVLTAAGSVLVVLGRRPRRWRRSVRSLRTT